MGAEAFAIILDRLEALDNERGLQILTVRGRAQVVQLGGDADAIIPFLVTEGRELLRRLANGDQLEPAEAGKAHRVLQGAGE